MRATRRTVTAMLGALSATPFTARAATIAPQSASSAQDALTLEGRYLPRWIELSDEAGERARVLAMLGPEQADQADWVLRDGRTQYASFLGDEATALSDASRSTTAPDPAADLEALDAIVEASRGHRVVMLNEAHVASRHRALLGRLVPRLRAEGFTHLAAEAFDASVADMRPGDRLAPKHGWYTRDPVFAEAVRHALALGYRLVPYEQRDDQESSDPSLSHAATMVREQAQADNLKAALAADPDIRVLVFVGYGHLRERGPAFAARFKRDTGVDPLTIGQAGTGAFGPHVEDAPPVRALLERFRPTAPVVLLNAGASPRSAAREEDLTAEETDLLVLHPALPDVDGRPEWLASDPARRRLAVTLPAGPGPRLLQAIHMDDPDPAIPADQFLAADEGGQAVLYLRPGRYRLRLETAAGLQPIGEGVEV